MFPLKFVNCLLVHILKTETHDASYNVVKKQNKTVVLLLYFTLVLKVSKTHNWTILYKK